MYETLYRTAPDLFCVDNHYDCNSDFLYDALPFPEDLLQESGRYPPEIMRVLNEKYHLDDPLWKQYVDYMKGLFSFDLGPSFSKIGDIG